MRRNDEIKGTSDRKHTLESNYVHSQLSYGCIQTFNQECHNALLGVHQIRLTQGGKTHDTVGKPSVNSFKVVLTVTLCSPVRFGHSHSSWLSDRVRTQGVSPISTV